MFDRRMFLKWLMQIPFLGPMLSGIVLPAPHQKPLMLNIFHVAGFQFYKGADLLHKMQPGQSLQLVREADNPHDTYAVKIIFENTHIGYVPRSDNRPISRMLNGNIPLSCRIKNVSADEEPWKALQVEIFLGLSV